MSNKILFAFFSILVLAGCSFTNVSGNETYSIVSSTENSKETTITKQKFNNVIHFNLNLDNWEEYLEIVEIDIPLDNISGEGMDYTGKVIRQAYLWPKEGYAISSNGGKITAIVGKEGHIVYKDGRIVDTGYSEVTGSGSSAGSSFLAKDYDHYVGVATIVHQDYPQEEDIDYIEYEIKRFDILEIEGEVILEY